MKRLAALSLGTLLACAGQARARRPLTLEQVREPVGLRLILHPEAGARINARLKPALELADGTILRFDAAGLSPDSAYFAEAPELTLPSGSSPRGKLRASVCREGEHVCRIIEVAVIPSGARDP